MLTIKRIWIMMLMCLVASPLFAASQWDKTQLKGDISVSDIDAYNQVNNEAQDRMLYNYREGLVCVASSSSQISVLAGEIAIPNSGGTVVKYRRNTSTTTVNWDNLDAGSEAASTYYYVYCLADSDATTCTFKISTAATAPTGATYYRKIGYLYNNADSNIVNVGNIKSGGVGNIVSVTGATDITTTSTSYTDMTDMEIRFVSSGRPVKITFKAPMQNPNTSGWIYTVIDIDGTDYAPTRKSPNTNAGTDEDDMVSITLQTLSAGTHIIKTQWKVVAGTGYQYGTLAERILIVEEQ